MLDVQRPIATRRSVAHRLNEEWADLMRDPSTRLRMAAWPAASPAAAFAEPAALLSALDRDAGLSRDGADALLGEVVRIARDDTLAARLVLQRLIPPLVMAAVRRTRSRPGDRQGLFDDLAATAWVVIRSYPLDRRPIKIAVNILRDTEYLTCVRPGRLRSAGEEPTAIDPEAAELGRCRLDGTRDGDVTAAAEVDALLAFGVHAGLDRTDLAMVAHVHLLGRPVAEVAHRFQVTDRTVRNRRAALASRLAAMVAA